MDAECHVPAPRQRGRCSRTTYLLWLSLSGILLLLMGQPAQAQEVSDRIAAKVTEGIDNYDMLMLEEAEAALVDAVELAEREGVTGEAAAKAYLMLGIVRFAQTRDEAAALSNFIQAVEAEPSVDIDPVYQTPKLAEIMEKARTRAKPAPPPPSETDTRPSRDLAQLQHTPPQTARASQPLTLEVFVDAQMPAYRMFLYHRGFRESSYTKTEMQPTSATRFAVDIPPAELQTSQFEYYIEAADRGGSLIATYGSAEEPVSLIVLGSEGSSEDPEQPAPEDPALRSPSTGDPSVYLSLGPGSSVGFIIGGSPTANPDRDFTAGLGPAFLHLMVEGGWIINPKMWLGLMLRLQFLPGQDFSTLPAESLDKTFSDECLGLGLPGDCLLGLKYRYFLSDAAKPFRFYSSFGLGVGRVRNWLQLRFPADEPVCRGKAQFVDPETGIEFCNVRDTVRGGWFHAGAGAGFTYAFSDSVHFWGDSYLMFLVPDTAVNLDVTGGLLFTF